MTKKNYNYVSEHAVMIITAETEEEAETILNGIVKHPLCFRLDHIEPIEHIYELAEQII